MTPTEDVSAQLDAARQQSKAVWDATVPGWHAWREEMWNSTRPVSEWMVRKFDPHPGDTVLELAAGLGDTGLMTARPVGESGCVIITDFAPEMVAAARQRAEELGVQNAQFRVLDPAKAFTETRRVLQPGGWLAFSVWVAPERNQWASLVGKVLSCVLQALPPVVQARVQEHVYGAAEPFRSGEGYDFPAACLSAVTR